MRMDIYAANLVDGETVSGGLKAKLDDIMKSGSGKLIMETFEEFVRESYGERSADGMHFRKSKEIYENFRFSPAYDMFFNQLVTDAKFAADFINGIIPTPKDGTTAAVVKPQDFKPKADGGLKVVRDVPQAEETPKDDLALSEEELDLIRAARAAKEAPTEEVPTEDK